MYAVLVENDYIGLMGRHVFEGQLVTPGLPLIDIMTPEGMVETIFSQGWGVVAHIEGGRIFPSSNDNREEDDEEDDQDDGESGSARGGSGGSSSVFPRGSLICHIVGPDGWQAGTIRGLTPRPTTVIAKRRARQFNLM
jgi:hypothetical protein